MVARVRNCPFHSRIRRNACSVESDATVKACMLDKGHKHRGRLIYCSNTFSI